MVSSRPLGHLAIILALFTAAHVAVRLDHKGNADTMGVSELKLGAVLKLENFVASGATDELSYRFPTACHIVVVFSAACPHCHAAADREASRSTVGFLPITWVTQSPAKSTFANRIAAGSELAFAGNAFQLFGIRAVPAAFLMRADTVVRHWSYSGTEDHDRLREQCF